MQGYFLVKFIIIYRLSSSDRAINRLTDQPPESDWPPEDDWPPLGDRPPENDWLPLGDRPPEDDWPPEGDRLLEGNWPPDRRRPIDRQIDKYAFYSESCKTVGNETDVSARAWAEWAIDVTLFTSCSGLVEQESFSPAKDSGPVPQQWKRLYWTLWMTSSPTRTTP